MQGSGLVIQVGTQSWSTASGVGKVTASASEAGCVLRAVVGALGNSLPALLPLASSAKPWQGNDGHCSGAWLFRVNAWPFIIFLEKRGHARRRDECHEPRIIFILVLCTCRPRRPGSFKPWAPGFWISHYPGATALCTRVCVTWGKETTDFLSSVFSWQMMVRNKLETPQRTLRTRDLSSPPLLSFTPIRLWELVNSWGSIVLVLLNAEIPCKPDLFLGVSILKETKSHRDHSDRLWPQCGSPVVGVSSPEKERCFLRFGLWAPQTQQAGRQTSSYYQRVRVCLLTLNFHFKDQGSCPSVLVQYR